MAKCNQLKSLPFKGLTVLRFHSVTSVLISADAATHQCPHISYRVYALAVDYTASMQTSTRRAPCHGSRALGLSATAILAGK